MSSSRHRGNITVSLFPFLTVLISTMGALIVMLVLAVRAAELKSQARAAENTSRQEQQLAALQEERELQDVLVRGWEEKQAELQAEWERGRQLQDYLRREIAELREQHREWQQRRENGSSNEPLNPADEERQLAELKELQQKLQAELAETQQVAGAAATEVWYSIVPYYGPHSTRRAPIYVECAGDRVILRPYNVELSLDDLAYTGTNNPLEVALTTIRQYWVTHNLGAEQGNPYPLLVVRPDGANAYARSRKAMVNWSDEFGYELISADLALDFGPADPQLQAELEQAVEVSRQSVAKWRAEQERITAEKLVLQRRAALAGGGSATSAGGLEVDRVNGGFRVTGMQSPVATERGRSNSQTTSEKNSSAIGSSDSPTSSQAREERKAASSATSPTETPGPAAGQGSAAANGGTGGPGESPSADGQAAGCLADQRGADWALPQKPGTRTGYLRPLRLYCSEDSLTFLPEYGSADERQVIPLAAATVDSIDQVVREVQRRVQLWGPAPAAGIWKPQLNIRILPGGENRARDLERLLHNSGLTLERSQP